MIGQVAGAHLTLGIHRQLPDLGPLREGQSPKQYKSEFRYDARASQQTVYIGLPETQEDVCRNTLTFSILRRKQHSGEWDGTLLVERPTYGGMYRKKEYHS